MGRGKPLLKKAMLENLMAFGKRFSGLMGLKLPFL